MHPEIVTEIEAQIAALGGTVTRDAATDLLWVNREFRASVVLARAQDLDQGRCRWKIRMDRGLAPDISIAARLDRGNTDILDYYLLPTIDFGPARISLGERNPAEIESYRFDSLDFLYAMAARSRVRLAA